MGQIEHRLEEIARLIQSDEDAAALRLHVAGVLESSSFSTSRRSGQFLHYIVDKAIAQQTDALKERTIGVEIFHRAPDYDTGEDAVVRVTASDVRRRLAQHYRQGGSSDFEISLPPGGYVPQIVRLSEPDSSRARVDDPGSPAAPVQWRDHPRSPLWIAAGIFAPALLLALLGWAGVHALDSHTAARQSVTPWRLLFKPGRPLYLVLGDPDLNEIQLLTGKAVLVSDYANGKLGCDTLEAGLRQVCLTSLRGDKVAAVDATAIARIAALASAYGSIIEPHTARGIRLTDLQGDRNIVFLGSSRANPWTDLFSDKLDLNVIYDQARGLQVVHNVRPRPGELEWYVPTAGPQGTGGSYTLITFLPNLSGNGYAMLLTGATHEGTDEAVAIVTDEQRFGGALRRCSLEFTASAFQMLVRLDMMAGSPLTSQVVTCHRV